MGYDRRPPLEIRAFDVPFEAAYLRWSFCWILSLGLSICNAGFQPALQFSNAGFQPALGPPQDFVTPNFG